MLFFLFFNFQQIMPMCSRQKPCIHYSGVKLGKTWIFIATSLQQKFDIFANIVHKNMKLYVI